MTTITNLPAAPEPTDTTAEFNAKAFAWVGAIDNWTDQVNALAVAVDADASTATTKAGQASVSAVASLASQNAASVSAVNASNSAGAALSSANSAIATYDQFDDRYLGSKASAPTLDNDGSALLTGALYFNSVTQVMNVYTGVAWSATYIPVTGYAPIADPQFTGEIKVNGNDVPNQTDIGTDPNQIPLNQFLGTMTYQDSIAVNIGGGTLTNVTSSGYSIQPAVSAITTAGSTTLTVEQIQTLINTVTQTDAVTLVLPTGTLTDAGVLNGLSAVRTALRWTVINLGSASGAVTMSGGTGHTYVGNATVAIATSARFKTVKTATNTFVTYRIA